MSDKKLYLAAHGVITDGSGRILLAMRDDARTWALPGGALDPGELPPDAATREVQEETGLTVVPARLVAVYHLPFAGIEYLSFGFRCLHAGGELTPSRESPRLGFFSPDEFPRRMMGHSRERALHGARHIAPEPLLQAEKPSKRLLLAQRFVAPIVYRWFDLQRRLKGEPRYVPPPSWHVHVEAGVMDAEGRLLWLRQKPEGGWRLPGGRRLPGEAPWDTVRRLVADEAGLPIDSLSLREVLAHKDARVTLRFVGRAGGQPAGERARLFSRGDEPAGVTEAQRAWVGSLAQESPGVRFAWA